MALFGDALVIVTRSTPSASHAFTSLRTFGRRMETSIPPMRSPTSIPIHHVSGRGRWFFARGHFATNERASSIIHTRGRISLPHLSSDVSIGFAHRNLSAFSLCRNIMPCGCALTSRPLCRTGFEMSTSRCGVASQANGAIASLISRFMLCSLLVKPPVSSSGPSHCRPECSSTWPRR